MVAKYYLVSSSIGIIWLLSIEFQSNGINQFRFLWSLFSVPIDFKYELMNQIYKIYFEMKFLDDLVFENLFFAICLIFAGWLFDGEHLKSFQNPLIFSLLW